MTAKMIADFLISFKKRTPMFVSQCTNYTVVTSFLDGFLYCAYLNRNTTRHFYWAISEWYQQKRLGRQKISPLVFSEFFRNHNNHLTEEELVSEYIDTLILYFQELDKTNTVLKEAEEPV